jgi:HEAT repeat protein
MHDSEREVFYARIRDFDVPLGERIDAARALAGLADDEALADLIDLALDEELPSEVAYAVGLALAQVAVTLDRMDSVPLAEFSASAYEGYDEYVAVPLEAPGPVGL